MKNSISCTPKARIGKQSRSISSPIEKNEREIPRPVVLIPRLERNINYLLGNYLDSISKFSSDNNTDDDHSIN